MKKPIFVMYTYTRECEHNPSWDRFQLLPLDIQSELTRRQEARRAQRRLRPKASRRRRARA